MKLSQIVKAAQQLSMTSALGGVGQLPTISNMRGYKGGVNPSGGTPLSQIKPGQGSLMRQSGGGRGKGRAYSGSTAAKSRLGGLGAGLKSLTQGAAGMAMAPYRSIGRMFGIGKRSADEAYLYGFIEKCAEHGVDPEALAKAAQGLFSPQTLKQVVGAGKNPNEVAPAKKKKPDKAPEKKYTSNKSPGLKGRQSVLAQLSR